MCWHDKKKTVLRSFKVQTFCSKLTQAFCSWHVVSQTPSFYRIQPRTGNNPSLPCHSLEISSSTLAPTSLDILRLFLLPESGGGPRTLDPKAIWQTSWFLLFRTLPVPLLRNWSVLLKEGNNSRLMSVMALIKNAEIGAQYQIRSVQLESWAQGWAEIYNFNKLTIIWELLPQIFFLKEKEKEKEKWETTKKYILFFSLRE